MFYPLKDFFFKKNFLVVIYLLIAVVAFMQIQGKPVNNWIIFRQSFYHLKQGLPLYIEYPAEYYDYFFYNPVFVVLIAPFAVFQSKIGLGLWILATSLIPFYAIRKLPIDERKKSIFNILIIFDLLNNLQYPQSNPLLLAFILFTWVMMEKRKFGLAALFIVLGFCIKGYGGIIGLLVFFNKSWWKTILYGIGWFLLLHLPLLLFISPAQLKQEYIDWLQIISSTTIKEKFSLYGVANLVSSSISETVILIIAFVALGVFLFLQRIKPDKLSLVAFLLIWIVVFNRAAESATYIFAIAGSILWFLGRERSKAFSILFWTTIIVASIFPTNVLTWVDDIRYHYYLKAILCSFILVDMILFQANLYPKFNHPSKKLGYEI